MPNKITQISEIIVPLGLAAVLVVLIVVFKLVLDLAWTWAFIVSLLIVGVLWILRSLIRETVNPSQK